jgi:hypothetical protein
MKTGYKKGKRKNREIQARQEAVRASGELQLSFDKEDLVRDLRKLYLLALPFHQEPHDALPYSALCRPEDR